MTKMRKPVDPKIIEAEERLLIDCQILLQETISNRSMTRSALAERAGMSKARLSQIMRPEANPTIKTMARLFHALGEDLFVTTKNKGSCMIGRDASSEASADKPWNCTEAPSVAAKIDDEQFVALLKEAARGAAASNDNYSPVVIMDSDVMVAILEVA
jgi:transcriptional regulator with XRE-family HTH domain